MRQPLRFFYDTVVVVGLLLFLPRILWRKKLTALRQRLRSDPPDPQGRAVIWLHAVSVGEVKAAKRLLQKIKEQHPNAFILATTATSAGIEEAKRSLSQADAIRFMPLDVSWLIRKWVCLLRPQLLLFVESDLWIQLLQTVKEIGGRTALVSGKLSERSANRFAKIPFFAKTLYSLVDVILVQNAEYRDRLAPFVPEKEKLRIGGNLKLEATAQTVDRNRFAPYFQGDSFSIAIVSTHAPEELELLDALQSVEATLYLAPRHPERFEEVAELLESKRISYCRWSRITERKGQERVILIDAMGKLPIFFTFVDLAIVAGSFSSRIGGHNVLEPCLYGTPVFFGPHMHQQKEFAARVLEAGAGRQVELSEIASAIRSYAQNPLPMRQAARGLFEGSSQILETTWAAIRALL